jgi:hypothetical protein
LKKEAEERLRWVGDVARFLDESSPVVAAPAAVSTHRRSWLWPAVAASIALALADHPPTFRKRKPIRRNHHHLSRNASNRAYLNRNDGGDY